MHSRELEETGDGSRIGFSIREDTFREGPPAWSFAMRLQHLGSESFGGVMGVRTK